MQMWCEKHKKYEEAEWNIDSCGRRYVKYECGRKVRS